MKQRYLIINADDFGISRSTNEAILQLFQAEKITSAGILAPAPHADDACRLAKDHSLPVGVHWTLHSDWPGENAWKPCAKREKTSSLLQEDRLTWDKARVSKAKSSEVTAELEAQYQYLISHGCRIDHADSHGGTLYGTNGRLFFINAFRLCQKYNLPFRFAKKESFLVRQFGNHPGLSLQLAQKAIVGCSRIYRVSLLDDFYSEPHAVSRIQGLADLKAYYEKQLGTLTGDIAEVFLHPSCPDDALLQRTNEWQKRIWEYEYLKSGDLIKAAGEQGFTVVSWKEAFEDS